MTSLLTIRDTIKDFFSKYDRILNPAVKFITSFAMFWSLLHLTGYNAGFSNILIPFLLSVVCAFMTDGITLALGGVFCLMQFFSASKEIAAVFIVLFIIMYGVYIRFFPKTAWLIMFAPLFFIFKVQYLLPLIAGMFVGPAAMISVAFGCILYYFADCTSSYVDLMKTTNEDDIVEGYKYMIQNLAENKELILTIVAFAVVIVVVSIIHKLSFQYSWYISIFVGAVVEILLFLVGNFVMEANVSALMIVLGTMVSILIAVAVQFFKVVVDYSRVENTQFEDDDYYYYVKAVPKVSLSKEKKNVKTISSSEKISKVVEDDFPNEIFEDDYEDETDEDELEQETKPTLEDNHRKNMDTSDIAVTEAKVGGNGGRPMPSRRNEDKPSGRPSGRTTPAENNGHNPRSVGSRPQAANGRPRPQGAEGRPRPQGAEGRPRPQAGEGRPRPQGAEGRPRPQVSNARPRPQTMAGKTGARPVDHAPAHSKIQDNKSKTDL